MHLDQLFGQKTSYYKDNLNELVVKYVAPHQKVLDVGCSEGRLGGYLKRHKGATVTGVDISEVAVKKARRNLDFAYALNIDDEELPLSRNSFDVIICADVLEHLYDPLSSLKKLKGYLRSSGIFVLSIPNVANIKTRWDLLLGKFDYQKSGILDESHLRFFTERSLQQLVQAAGLQVLKMDYTPGFSFLFLQGRILKHRFFKNFQYQLTKIKPSLFCAQFIVVAGYE